MTIEVPRNARIVTPYITVLDADESIGFYKSAFGFELVENEVLRNAEGKAVHVAMAYDGKATVMFGQESEMCPEMKSPATTGMDVPVVFYVYCEDVDGFTENARENGATVLSEPENMFWGDRVARFSDPDRYLWTFATNVGGFDASKMPEGFVLK